ncbi:hypothetical protein BH09BAC4_BH09BAC4_35860 [soil metagenome]
MTSFSSFLLTDDFDNFVCYLEKKSNLSLTAI